MGPIALDVEVTDSLPPDVTDGKRLTISAWLFFPDDPVTLGERPVTMTLLAGGSYDKRYHHAVIPGFSGYSAAEHLAALGNVVILADHLGVGESSRAPNQSKATRQICASAMHAAVEEIHRRLAEGDVHPTLPPLAAPVRIGGGHSMGAMQTVVQQARHRTYDAIMFLGYTTQGVHFYHGTTRVRAGDYMPPEPYVDYAENDRAAQRYNFYWGDVPAQVIAFDDTLAVPTPTQIGLDSIRLDIIKEDAAAIDVPVFFGNSERDVSPDPQAEAARFSRCTDFTMYLLPHAAHCQTYAGTRQLFWDRMHGWSRSVTWPSPPA
ncbi:hypothetical protein [Novosphingobium sp. JCM 18896]|uniref:hypothetical protein n=1 Tax=Novosphingobium sp. JCM 18896 TaxID=2989731 RepID=UPI002222016A|nr:hypothetical protein [Novosphingobium sp. JCM 18896]MCW1431647.1 hypothetical protein [Novosphingobium sp. JCM 18896]